MFSIVIIWNVVSRGVLRKGDGMAFPHLSCNVRKFVLNLLKNCGFWMHWAVSANSVWTRVYLRRGRCLHFVHGFHASLDVQTCYIGQVIKTFLKTISLDHCSEGQSSCWTLCSYVLLWCAISANNQGHLYPLSLSCHIKHFSTPFWFSRPFFFRCFLPGYVLLSV